MTPGEGGRRLGHSRRSGQPSQGTVVPDVHPTFEKMVRRLDRRSPLDQADRQALLSLPHTSRKLPPSAHIIRDGDRPEHVCLLLTGFAHRYKLTGQGGRQIISIHMASEFVDLQNGLLSIADHSVQTLTETEVALIPRRA